MSDSSIALKPVIEEPVEAHPVVERALELLQRDGKALQVALDVREPGVDELDVLVLDLHQHALARGQVALRPAGLDLRLQPPP